MCFSQDDDLNIYHCIKCGAVDSGGSWHRKLWRLLYNPFQYSLLPAEPSTELLSLCALRLLSAIDKMLKIELDLIQKISMKVDSFIHTHIHIHTLIRIIWSFSLKVHTHIYYIISTSLQNLSGRENMKGGRYTYFEEKNPLDYMVHHWLSLWNHWSNSRLYYLWYEPVTNCSFCLRERATKSANIFTAQ